MRININQRCKFVLTEYGAEIFNNHYKELRRICTLFTAEDVKCGDELILPLWDIMSVFGNYITMGSQIPFKDNEINICESL